MSPLKVNGPSCSMAYSLATGDTLKDYMDPKHVTKQLLHWHGKKHRQNSEPDKSSTLSTKRFSLKGENVDLKKKRFIWYEPQEEIYLLIWTPHGQKKACI